MSSHTSVLKAVHLPKMFCTIAKAGGDWQTRRGDDSFSKRKITTCFEDD